MVVRVLECRAWAGVRIKWSVTGCCPFQKRFRGRSIVCQSSYLQSSPLTMWRKYTIIYPKPLSNCFRSSIKLVPHPFTTPCSNDDVKAPLASA